MRSRIPKPIRLEALRKWLDGKFRDDIAKELQISQGAVSSIINDFRKDDSQFDLLREVAVKIKKQGMDPASFAPLIREVLAYRNNWTRILRTNSEQDGGPNCLLRDALFQTKFIHWRFSQSCMQYVRYSWHTRCPSRQIS